MSDHNDIDRFEEEALAKQFIERIHDLDPDARRRIVKTVVQWSHGKDLQEQEPDLIFFSRSKE